MMCAWDSLLEIIPRQMRQEVDRIGKRELQEFRLRLGSPPELVLRQESKYLNGYCSGADIAFCVQSASRYSPWAAESIRHGYLTAPGGHRIGLCGLSVYRNGQPSGLREITSLCIRVARDFSGISKGAPENGSVLILGAPGWGKTTLLRDLIRVRSEKEMIAVVDERGELFPPEFQMGKKMDVLRGCGKKWGMEQVLRTMGPQCIAVDEITAEEDSMGILQAVGCGVEILATAHATTAEEFVHRSVYRTLAERRVFDFILTLKPDKTFTVERMCLN